MEEEKDEKPAPVKLTIAERRIKERLEQHWHELDPWAGPIDSTTPGLCGLHPPTAKAISTSLSRLPALGLSSLARLVARHPSRRAMRYPAFQLIDPPPKLYDHRLLLGGGCLLLGDHRQQSLPRCRTGVSRSALLRSGPFFITPLCHSRSTVR